MTRGKQILFHEVTAPITDPVTKFGGQPIWIEAPRWPCSRETGNPMRFIGQFALADLAADTTPDDAGRMAYLFMTEEEGDAFVDGTYEPEGGENAVIVQPGEPPVPCVEQANGPALFRMVEKSGHHELQPEACEFRIELGELPEEDEDEFLCQLGGVPNFMQGDEVPSGFPRLLVQLDACSVPFYLNFGDAGVGYAFLDEAGTEGRFLWQCG